MKPNTQAERVLDYLRHNGSITTLEAFERLDILDLQGRIQTLKRNGVKIGDSPVKTKDRFGTPVQFKRYYIIEED